MKQRKELIISICLSLAILFSSFFSIISVKAYNSDTGEYSNSESATSLDSFNGDVVAQNAYKMWSVFRAVGMNEYQACAAMGSCSCEGGFKPFQIEYAGNGKKYKNNNNVDGNEEYDHNGQQMMYETGSHYCTTTGGILTQADVDKYIEEISSRMENGDFRTKCTNDTMRGYGVPENIITELNKPEDERQLINDDPDYYKHVPSNIYSGGSYLTLNCAFYYPNGVGTTGMGLFGFTGTVWYKLVKFAEDNGGHWYDMETQLAFIIAKEDEGGCYGNRIENYIRTTKDFTTVEECEKYWAGLIAGDGDGTNPTNMGYERVKSRADAGNVWYTRLTANKDATTGENYWDATYADSILKTAGRDELIDDDGIKDKSIVHNYVNPAIVYPQNGGFMIDSSYTADQYTSNVEVFKEYVGSLSTAGNKSTTVSYSLFELFGEDIHWYRYTGESTITPKLFDHIWSAYDQDKLDELKAHPIKTIKFTTDNYLSCQVYPGRPDVLSKADIDNGDSDPRVLAMSNSLFAGARYVKGTIYLAISKYIVAFVSLLCSNKMLDYIIDFIEIIQDVAIFDLIRILAGILTGLAMAFFIWSLAIKGAKYGKGTGTAKEAIERFIIGMLCLGFIAFGLAQPKAFNHVFRKVAGIVNDIFDEALTADIEDDEVIAVKDPDKAINAVLWKTAIFGPWCRGQFDGLEYDELYTQYASLEKGQKAMPQSHDDIDYTASSDTIFYDSASLTGDVFVPVGGGKYIRNWAAYLYSCGSKYHIDSTLDKKKADNISLDNLYFPHTSLMTTAYNSTLAADTFRIVDAQMNISPQYYNTGNEVVNYTGANSLSPNYKDEGRKMLFNTAMLLFLMPMIISKIMNFMLLLFTLMKLILYSIAELYKEQNNLKQCVDSVKKHFGLYFLACLKICLIITLYYKFIDKGFFRLAIYVILCCVILGFSPDKIKQTKYKLESKLRYYKNRRAASR